MKDLRDRSAEFAGVMRLTRQPVDIFKQRFCTNFIRAPQFNVTRIIQFCVPKFSIFETMCAAKKPPASGGN